MGLMADLGPGSVALDTAVFIYFIEEDPRFLPLIDPLFREADDGTRELVSRRSPCLRSSSSLFASAIALWPIGTRRC